MVQRGYKHKSHTVLHDKINENKVNALLSKLKKINHHPKSQETGV